MKIKEVDDVLGGKESWANVDKVDGECEGALTTDFLPQEPCPLQQPQDPSLSCT